ncbi:cAMP-binding domain of CRP or a regulatory subunit of cAMP-dependent protein kinases [Flexibacter flexilis DSM 6793]|uniref:cAMP-binding domain of CRP or a regulatory subunit of cAMP-dependent protein kinases n=1 Tax=Flexibacter flexilis DSM 6793 TaxID=927664 RepID=A0A1I1DN91_9BACT|nr:Crp/Fnr family transcriptional regulator [Flexibacter flexilis]SFB75896.1 cAMP-binding domain of CRP or a regulatory subunit of cAMP-dependent protein kinases [Flexibacter flexilis DSM 6793]
MENQDHYKALIDYFKQITTLDENEEQLVRELFVYNSYNRKEFLLKEGEICRQFNFIIRGCMRMYLVDDKANMHILQFAAENWIMVDALSFREKNASRLYIDTLEKTELLYITPENLKLLYHKAPKFNCIIRELLERHVVALQKRLLQYMSSSGEERYLSFLKTYSQFSNRLPQTQIAAYLGITPEHLSKIRNDIAKSKKFTS